MTIYGFWSGIWHGYSFPVTLIAKLFGDSFGLWASINTGAGYWIGFYLGSLFWAFIIGTVLGVIYVCFTEKFKSFFTPFLIVLFFHILSIISAGCFTKIDKEDIPQLTPDQVRVVFSYKSPKDGAYYYKQRREYYDFMDEFYCDSIIPIVIDAGYLEVKDVYDILKGTPAGDILYPVFKEMEYDYKNTVFERIDSLTAEAKIIFEKEVLPTLPMQLDDVLEQDAHDIVEKYCGGAFNIRKFALLMNRGENIDRFESCVIGVLNKGHYNKAVQTFCDEYLTMVYSYQDEFCAEFDDVDKQLTLPKVPNYIRLSTDVKEITNDVIKLSDAEADDLFYDVMKDGVIPVGLAFTTGGLSNLYDAATLLIDVEELYDEIKNQKLSFNEKLELYIAGLLMSNINEDVDNINRFVCQAIDKNALKVKKQINSKL